MYSVKDICEKITQLKDQLATLQYEGGCIVTENKLYEEILNLQLKMKKILSFDCNQSDTLSDV